MISSAVDARQLLFATMADKVKMPAGTATVLNAITESVMNAKIMALTLTFAFAAPLSANALDDGDFKNQKKRIEAQYRADQKKCSAFTENAKDICLAQANGTEKVARAELQSRRENTPEARHELRLAKAEAAHDIAKEKCDDMAGHHKDLCIKDALATFTRAKAEARVNRKASETR